MARSKIETGTRDAYRYSPGDGHTYTWDGHGEYAEVWRHESGTPAHPAMLLVPTGDVVPMTGCARTATAFTDHVDRWRK